MPASNESIIRTFFDNVDSYNKAPIKKLTTGITLYTTIKASSIEIQKLFHIAILENERKRAAYEQFINNLNAHDPKDTYTYETMTLEVHVPEFKRPDLWGSALRLYPSDSLSVETAESEEKNEDLSVKTRANTEFFALDTASTPLLSAHSPESRASQTAAKTTEVVSAGSWCCCFSFIKRVKSASSTTETVSFDGLS
ncbi:MAG: hypothetical protein Q7V63_02575 [Gammaproteobacteria bacterium]|nr:hypothetical protein [Gammaproteobacteria bacterium]